MSTIDWNKVRFRASSWGSLLSEPQSKADKEAGKLSKTCIAELVKIYNLAKYDRKKDITTRQMDKGILAEDDSITLVGRVDKKMYEKNKVAFENDWFTGHPDVLTEEGVYGIESVLDIKTSWDLDTFIPKLFSDVDSAYEAQLNVYFDLTGAKGGFIAYCLVSAPQSILFSEHEYLLRSGNFLSAESEDFQAAWAEKEKLMVFDDIPIHERVIKHYVERDDQLIQKMKDKVPRLRQFLADMDEKHTNLNK
jgi:hypothetical protein